MYKCNEASSKARSMNENVETDRQKDSDIGRPDQPTVVEVLKKRETDTIKFVIGTYENLRKLLEIEVEKEKSNNNTDIYVVNRSTTFVNPTSLSSLSRETLSKELEQFCNKQLIKELVIIKLE